MIVPVFVFRRPAPALGLVQARCAASCGGRSHWMNHQTIDPITLEIWWSRLVAIADEAAATLVRTAFSTIIREWRLSARLPGHTISLAYTPAATPAKRGERQIHFAGRGNLPATV